MRLPIRARCSGGITALHIVPEPGARFSLPSTRNCPAIVTG
jgi:hypothetical protein